MDDVAVSIDVTTGLERKLTIKIPSEDIESQTQNRLNELAVKVRREGLKGFSPGRAVPFKIVKQRFSKGVREEVVHKLSKSYLSQALEQEAIKLASLLSFNATPNDTGEDATLVVVIEVFPDIKIEDLAEVTIEKLVAEVTEQNVENALESLQKKAIEWIEVERTVKNGDKVTIDYESVVEGSNVEEAAQHGFELELGREIFPIDFEQRLLGCKVGDELAIEVNCPNSFYQKELAGRQVQFTVQVKAIAQPKLPALDAGFANRFNITEGGIEALRKEIYDNLFTQLDYKVQLKNKEIVLDKLWELNKIELPNSLVEEEMKHLQTHYKSFKSQTQDSPQGEDVQTKIAEKAQRQVGIGLLLREYASVHGIKVDTQRVNQRVEKLSKSYQRPEELKAWFNEDTKRLQGVAANVLEEQVVEKLLDNATITEKVVDLDSVMNLDSEFAVKT